jgi:hypothetical protein
LLPHEQEGRLLEQEFNFFECFGGDRENGEGFQFTEGPLRFPEGYLWFSDVIGNVVRQWSPMAQSPRFCGTAAARAAPLSGVGLLHLAGRPECSFPIPSIAAVPQTVLGAID